MCAIVCTMSRGACCPPVFPAGLGVYLSVVERDIVSMASLQKQFTIAEPAVAMLNCHLSVRPNLGPPPLPLGGVVVHTTDQYSWRRAAAASR